MKCKCLWFLAASITLGTAAAQSQDKPLPARPATTTPISPISPIRAAPTAPAKPAQPAKALPWLTSLAEGQRQAVKDRKPLLIRVGASWCPPCRKLDAEIEKPAAQAELARWTLVFLDADKAEDEAREFNVNGIPALRIRTALGDPIASHDGFMPAEDLASWLKKEFEAAAADVDDVLLSNDEPDAAAVVRLVGHLQQRNPALRETAIRRLAAYPQKARNAVVEAFQDGKLSRRLAAMELLRLWKAPVHELDPWQPESFTKERIAALNLWAEKFQPPAASEPAKPSAQALAEARRDIERMLKADERDAAAIRHRLAALGPALLPDVAARLKAAADDAERKRLWELRYALAAAESLGLRWPGGLERLADSDPRHRQKAADELARLATAADQPLLIELFGDNDPLVREFSLRGLQNIGGKEATAALVNLLSDPEPNIRAAVLKQFEEKPDPKILPKLAEYVKTEKDADLVVHAIRFLREAGSAEAARILLPLLSHESWQVRAEACEALGKMESNGMRSFGVQSGDEAVLQAEVYAALLGVLDDSDAFVVSRAVEGLANVDMVVAVGPLVRAAAKHPELAPKIVEMLARGSKMRASALPHLRKFRQHENPLVRAAALRGLCDLAPGEMGAEISSGLKDPSDKVRIAAAAICFRNLESQRVAAYQQFQQQQAGQNGAVESEYAATPVEESSSVFGGLTKALGSIFAKPAKKPQPAVEGKPAAGGKTPESKKVEESEYELWLKDYFENKRWPPWAGGQIAGLEKMLKSESADEQTAAAMALVPLGKAQAVLPLLYAKAQSDSKRFREVTGVLPWLAWERRQAAFRQLRKIASFADSGYYLFNAMVMVRDRRALSLLWEALADGKATETETAWMERDIMELFGISYWNVDNGRADPAMVKSLQEMAVALKPYAAGGSDLQRLMALGLLTYADPDEARQVAQKFHSDAKAGSRLRTAAFQIGLVLATPKEAAAAASAALSDKDPARQKLGLQYLVDGPEGLRNLPNSIFIRTGNAPQSVRTGQPIVPEPPPGLQAGQLLPLASHSDPQIAAEAGYLLALMGESRGLEPLLRYYRQQGKDDSQTQRLVYRAIAALDDSTQIPVLRKIYEDLRGSNLSEFYWTIRSMTGPDILRLRQQIRDEVGVQQLQ
jgi:HEAT repeat protein/thiol-disulfide isomerase/thioredoxin